MVTVRILKNAGIQVPANAALAFQIGDLDITGFLGP